MVRELTQSEFESTLTDEMRLLSEDDKSCESIPVFEYVEQCLGVIGVDFGIDDLEFHYAYMNDEKGYCHAGFNWGEESTYLVVVMDVGKKNILGYCVLDLSRSKK